MPSSERFAVTLPKDLHRSVERMRRVTGESRSAIVQRALREILAEGEQAERLRRYAQGYADAPETPEEIAAAENAAAQLLAEEPWE